MTDCISDAKKSPFLLSVAHSLSDRSLELAHAEPPSLAEDFFSVDSIIHQVPESFALREECAIDPRMGRFEKTNKSSTDSTYTFSDTMMLRGTGVTTPERFGLATSNVFKFKKQSGYSWRPLNAHDTYQKDSVAANTAKVFDYAHQGAILVEKAYSSRIGQLVARLYMRKAYRDDRIEADDAYVDRHPRSFASFLIQSHLLNSNRVKIEDPTVDPHCPTGAARSILFGSTFAIFNYFGDQERLALLPPVGSIDSHRAKRGDRIKLLKSHFCTAFSSYRAISQILPDGRDIAVKVKVQSKAESLQLYSRNENSGTAVSYSYRQNTTTSEIYITVVSTKTGKELLLFPILAAKEVLFTDLWTGNQKNYWHLSCLPWHSMKQVIAHSTFIRHDLADFRLLKRS